MIKPSDNCYALIRSFEGLFLHAYADAVHKLTIGYGTIQYPNGKYVQYNDTCTKEQAQEWLEYEVNQKAAGVNHLIKDAKINQNQFDALVSFAYNLGLEALKESTLLKKLLVNPNNTTIWKYDHDGAGNPIKNSCEFLKWIHAGHVVLPGLVRRRAAEADLYGKEV